MSTRTSARFIAIVELLVVIALLTYDIGWGIRILSQLVEKFNSGELDLLSPFEKDTLYQEIAYLAAIFLSDAIRGCFSMLLAIGVDLNKQRLCRAWVFYTLLILVPAHAFRFYQYLLQGSALGVWWQMISMFYRGIAAFMVLQFIGALSRGENMKDIYVICGADPAIAIIIV